MKKEVYQQVRNTYVLRLMKYFNAVAVPIEAPGKESYGDVDIILAEPKPKVVEGSDSIVEVLTQVLGATHTKSTGINVYHFAVDFPAFEYIGMDSSSLDS